MSEDQWFTSSISCGVVISWPRGGTGSGTTSRQPIKIIRVYIRPATFVNLKITIACHKK